MSSNPKTSLTPEQYLEIERKAEFKSEYFRGEMFAMSGAKFSHNQLCTAIIFSLAGQLLDGPCEVVGSDMRVAVSADGLYTYPDVSVLCGAPRFVDNELDTLLNPTVIFEVLSPSTEAYDRGGKFELYQSIQSLRQYVLVASRRVHAEVFTRQSDGSWNVRMTSNPEDTLELESIGARLSMKELYARVNFGERGPEMGPPRHEELP